MLASFGAFQGLVQCKVDCDRNSRLLNAFCTDLGSHLKIQVISIGLELFHGSPGTFLLTGILCHNSVHTMNDEVKEKTVGGRSSGASTVLEERATAKW